jgi:hypothetical protein
MLNGTVRNEGGMKRLVPGIGVPAPALRITISLHPKITRPSTVQRRCSGLFCVPVGCSMAINHYYVLHFIAFSLSRADILQRVDVSPSATPKQTSRMHAIDTQ